MTEPLGCIISEEATHETVERMYADGMVVSFAGSDSSLVGHAGRQHSRGVTHVFAQDAEKRLTGQMRPAYRQTRGVCVSRGTGGAIQDSLLFALANSGRVGRPATIATEPIYAGSRQTIGRGQLGSVEGSCGCWAAEWVARFGVVERAVYGAIDLTKSNDDIACNWSSRSGQNVPKDIQEAGLTHKVSAHKVATTNELADAIFAGYFGAVCRSRYCSAVDTDGFGIFNNNGGHCTEVSGAYFDFRGQLQFVEQQSHGTGRPTPNPVARTEGGAVALRDGSYPVRCEAMADAIRTGEVWVFSVKRGHEFREVG